jgi:hypothetical protein
VSDHDRVPGFLAGSFGVGENDEQGWGQSVKDIEAGLLWLLDFSVPYGGDMGRAESNLSLQCAIDVPANLPLAGLYLVRPQIQGRTSVGDATADISTGVMRGV